MNKILLRFYKSLKTYSLPILSGLFIGTTYIPFFPWALAFCLVPLWIFWDKNRHSYKKLWIGSWITQFVLNIIGFHWVAHTSSEFGGFPPLVSYVILILFACVAHLYYPVAALLWAWCSKKIPKVFSWLLIPIAFSLCELLHPTIFFWHLGYPWLWIQLPGSHISEWIGFYGINLITLFINLFVLLFILKREKKYIISATSLFVIVNAIGLVLKQRAETSTDFTESLKVLVVQANIGNSIKVQQDKGDHFHDYILRKYLEITDTGVRAHPNTDLIVWPETAFPSPARKGNNIDFFQNKLRYSINTISIPLITGAYEEDEQGKVYNSLVLFDKKGDFKDSYRKTHLLAFGEFFPGASLYPKLKQWFPMVSDFGRGTGPKMIALNDELKVGAQICYESLFDSFSKKLVDLNSQIIINVTNDSWFGRHAEPYQHGYMTLARALEYRIPLIRSTNTGISTVVLASGKILEKSPIHQEWYGHYNVPYSKKPQRTLFSYYAGFWPLLIFVLFLGLFIGGSLVHTRKS